ncbi:MAG TPA: hypothetical protein VMX17_15515, partial [Candidatus Glassbacteria bacterium]|nr:hypothetical protein [Candidatus Glassbacteria bacterium]
IMKQKEFDRLLAELVGISVQSGRDAVSGKSDSTVKKRKKLMKDVKDEYFYLLSRYFSEHRMDDQF